MWTPRAFLHATRIRRTHRIGQAEADRLVAGDLPGPPHAALRELLDAARAPATADELSGERAAVAAFTAHRRRAARAARRHRARTRTAIVAVTTGVAFLSAGTAVAARTGNLPEEAQRHAHRLFSALGVPAPRTGGSSPSTARAPLVAALSWCDSWQGPGLAGRSPAGGPGEGASSRGPSPLGASPQGVSPLGASSQAASSQAALPQGPSPQGPSPQGPSPQGPSSPGSSPLGSSPLGASSQGPAPRDASPPGPSPSGDSPLSLENRRRLVAAAGGENGVERYCAALRRSAPSAPLASSKPGPRPQPSGSPQPGASQSPAGASQSPAGASQSPADASQSPPGVPPGPTGAAGTGVPPVPTPTSAPSSTPPTAAR